MKKYLKMLLVTVLSLSLLTMGSAMAFAGEEDIMPINGEKPANEFNVMLNGAYVAFTDAVPANVKGRIMVPYRAMLETLGAEVSWDQATKTVTAATEDTTISFVIGKSDINIVKNGVSSVKKMDVVPYIDPSSNRTFVSTRFMAESLDYTVGWDHNEKTAVIIDYNTLFANADKDFTKIDQYLKNAQTLPGTAYESLMKAAVDITIEKEMMETILGENAAAAEMNISMDGTAVSKDAQMSMDFAMNMNLDELVKNLAAASGETLDAADLEAIAALNDMTVTACADMEKGDLYFTTNLNALLGLKEGAWIHMNLNEIYSSMGIDFSGLMDAGMNGNATSVAAMLDMMGEMSADMMTVTTYDEMNIAYEAIKAILGDNNVAVKKVSGGTQYTVDFSNLAKLEGMEEMAGMISGKMVMVDRADSDDCDMTLIVDLDGMMTMKLSLDTTTATTTKPVKTLPAGAEVVEFTEIMNAAE